MKRITETIYPDATGKHHLVTVIDGETPLVLTPRTKDDALIIWEALKHIESGYRSRLPETTPAPFKRRVWYTDSGKVIAGERANGVEVYCFGLTTLEINDLQTALAEIQAGRAETKAAAAPTAAEAMKEAA
jgi:hypothetical protein